MCVKLLSFISSTFMLSKKNIPFVSSTSLFRTFDMIYSGKHSSNYNFNTNAAAFTINFLGAFLWCWKWQWIHSMEAQNNTEEKCIIREQRVIAPTVRWGTNSQKRGFFYPRGHPEWRAMQGGHIFYEVLFWWSRRYRWRLNTVTLWSSTKTNPQKSWVHVSKTSKDW